MKAWIASSKILSKRFILSNPSDESISRSPTFNSTITAQTLTALEATVSGDLHPGLLRNAAYELAELGIHLISLSFETLNSFPLKWK